MCRRYLAALLYASMLACRLERTQQTPASGEAVRGDVLPRLPSEPVALAGALGVSADSLRAAGEERYSRQAYDSAIAIWKVEITRARRANDSAAEARAMMWLGLAAWKQGDYKTARADGEASLALKRRLGMDQELSRSYNALGLLAWNEGKYSEALVAFDSAISTARRNHDVAGVARAVANVPLVEVELGNFESARADFSKALAAGQATKDDRLQGNVLANLAMLEIRLGRGSRALPLLDDARRHYSAIDYGPGVANALGQRATALSELGNLQLAIASADSALAIAKGEGLQQEVAATLEVLADLHAQAGDLRGVLRILHSADSLDGLIGLATEQGTNRRRAAAILTDLGESLAAIAPAREALAIHKKERARNEESYDRMQLASSLSLSGELVDAQYQADSALQLAFAMRNPAAVSDAIGVAADLALRRGDPNRALAYLDRDRRDITADEWRLADLRARALFALRRLNEARAEAERAVAALEKERASLAWGVLRAGYLASRVSPFSDLVAIDLAVGDTAAAFATAASVPGRSLTERIGTLESVVDKDLTPMIDRERRLLQIAALETELDDARTAADPPEKLARLTKSLQAARSDFEEFATTSSTPGSKYHERSASLSAIQTTLAPRDAIVLMLSGPSRLDVFVLRSNKVFHHGTAITDRNLGQRVRFAREAMSARPGAHTAIEPLASLFDVLIGPAARAGMLTGVARLTIVTHGALTALPFAALWDRAKGHHLIEDYVIRYSPSLAPLLESATQYKSLSSLSVFAPLPDSLPATLIEARAIASNYPLAETFIGSSATEDNFRHALTSGRPIHVASHGNSNAQNPLFSRIIVGRRRGTSPNDDGRVEVHEILSLKTTSPLIFLSGCETALAPATNDLFAQSTEEGSLEQAFLLAGAGTVIGTLWKVDDASAAKIAGSFYRALKAGSSFDQALAIAQRQAARDNLTYAWAAYDLFAGRSRNSSTAVRTTTP